MLAVLASVILAAAPAASPPALIDSEVPRYLRGAEVAEWSRARILFDQGQNRLAQGTSIVNTPRAPLKGAGFETPEQAKARGEAMVKEGQAQVQRATQTLERLRYTAAVRHAEATKMVSDTIEIAGYGWSEGLLVTTLRAQKAARDAGMARQHVLGAWGFDADGKASPSAELASDLRAAWGKAQGDRTLLQAEPAGGYRIVPPADADAPAGFAADWAAPTAANQVALVWGEIYPVSETASLIFVRVADAHTLRLLASECFVSAGRDGAALRAAVTLRDDRSFLPRIGENSVWRLGYPRETCHPLGAALLRHFCLRGARATVRVGEWLSDLLGGEKRLDDRSNVTWKIRLAPGSKGEFQVSALQAGGTAPTEVGLLTLQVGAVPAGESPADPAKPAAK